MIWQLSNTKINTKKFKILPKNKKVINTRKFPYGITDLLEQGNKSNEVKVSTSMKRVHDYNLHTRL